MEWLNREEQVLLETVRALSPSAEPYVWERQVAQAKGVLILIKAFRSLARDAKAIVEREIKK